MFICIIYYNMENKKKVLIVIANNGFQDYEFWVPFDMLTHAWISVSIAAWKIWECIWVFGSRTVADIELEKVKWENYDMIIFIWWWELMLNIFEIKSISELPKKQKLWAICITPMILSASKYLTGKQSLHEIKIEFKKNLSKIIEDFGWIKM